jgi:hypothetical protein
MAKLLFKMDLSYSKRSNTILYLIIHYRKKTLVEKYFGGNHKYGFGFKGNGLDKDMPFQ